MESECIYNLLQLPTNVEAPPVEELAQGEKKKYLQPDSRKNSKFEELQKVLMEWINSTLFREHIVVQNLEEDLFDGLVLHHLLQKLASITLEVEEIALTASNQKRKLTIVLEALHQCLQLEENSAKWNMESIFNKDLLATLHLLVAMAKHFQPDLALPANVQVEVVTTESTKSGLKTVKSVEQITDCNTDSDQQSKVDIFDELFKLAPEKVNAVKEAIVKFVNKNMERLGLSVKNIDTQAGIHGFLTMALFDDWCEDGVILILLIGQLEGYFLNLKDFFLTPSSPAEMLHNVNLAMDLLKEGDLLHYPVNPEDITNGDTKATLRVLYSLFSKHKKNEVPEETKIAVGS